MLDRTDAEAISRRVRRRILSTIHAAGVGHAGGSLSSVEVLVALYFDVLRFDATNPKWPQRDRFILSKGHASSALYSVLVERGLMQPDLLSSFGRIDSPLQVHPDMHRMEWVEISTGSLGQGLSVGVGTALGARLTGSGSATYVLLGDGECQEGQVWEAAMAAAHYGLDGLVAIVDDNQAQLTGRTSDVMAICPLRDKWAAFGWNVVEADGNDAIAVRQALLDAGTSRGRPSVVIAHTIKGKGVSFMEGGGHAWHGRVPTAHELDLALAELAETGRQEGGDSRECN